MIHSAQSIVTTLFLTITLALFIVKIPKDFHYMNYIQNVLVFTGWMRTIIIESLDLV